MTAAVALGCASLALVAAAGARRARAGAVIERLAGGSPGRRPGRPRGLRRPSSLPRPLLLGVAVVATGSALPAAGLALALAALALPGARARARRHRLRRDLVASIPDAADLFVVAAAAGLTVPLAVRAVADRVPPGPLAAEFRRVVAEADSGRLVSDALLGLVERVGEEIRPLMAALVSSDRYGAPLLAGLERAADDARRRRQRRAEERARRVPVLLLLPLAACILPAFALLTVAPLIANGLDAVRL